MKLLQFFNASDKKYVSGLVKNTKRIFYIGFIIDLILWLLSPYLQSKSGRDSFIQIMTYEEALLKFSIVFIIVLLPCVFPFLLLSYEYNKGEKVKICGIIDRIKKNVCFIKLDNGSLEKVRLAQIDPAILAKLKPNTLVLCTFLPISKIAIRISRIDVNGRIME